MSHCDQNKDRNCNLPISLAGAAFCFVPSIYASYSFLESFRCNGFFKHSVFRGNPYLFVGVSTAALTATGGFLAKPFDNRFYVSHSYFWTRKPFVPPTPTE